MFRVDLGVHHISPEVMASPMPCKAVIFVLLGIVNRRVAMQKWTKVK
jgi:hypothetical protein